MGKNDIPTSDFSSDLEKDYTIEGSGATADSGVTTTVYTNETVSEQVSEVDLLNDLLSDADESAYNPEEFSRANPPFNPTREKYNGLNLGKIVNIEIVKTLSPTMDEKGNLNEYEYAGLEVNKLHIQIDSADGVLPIRSYHHNFTIPVKTSNKGVTLTPSFYNNLINNVYSMIQELYTALDLQV